MRSIEAQYEAGETMRDEVISLAKDLQSPMFATRDSIGDAYDYVMRIVNTLPMADRPAVITAIQVLVNTIAQEVTRTMEV